MQSGRVKQKVKKQRDLAVIKTVFALSFFFFLGISILSSANASENLKVSAKKAATHSYSAQGLETFRGELISKQQLRDKSSDTKKLLGQKEIELSNGQILYSDEIEFVHVKRPPHGGVLRIPHDDDKRAPHN